MLTSKMSKKERKVRMAQLVSGKKRIVVSTYALFSTGIDIPKLEVLFMCAPMRSEVKLRQSAGRLMRKAEGKTSASIIDFVDRKVGLLAAQSRKRANVLKKL
jgi:superfamily II DNA or RNA helicase